MGSGKQPSGDEVQPNLGFLAQLASGHLELLPSMTDPRCVRSTDGVLDGIKIGLIAREVGVLLIGKIRQAEEVIERSRRTWNMFPPNPNSSIALLRKIGIILADHRNDGGLSGLFTKSLPRSLFILSRDVWNELW